MRVELGGGGGGGGGYFDLSLMLVLVYLQKITVIICSPGYHSSKRPRK